MTAMMLFGTYVRAESDGNLFRSPTHDDDTSSMDETSTSRKRNLAATTSPNQLNGLSLGHVDMGESSRKKRKLTTTTPNQEDNYYLLELPPESYAKIERNLATRSPPNQEDGLSLGLHNASSTQEYQPAMQNPNQVDALSLALPTASSTQQDQPAMQNPNKEDGLSLELSLALPTASSTQQDQPPAMQNPNQEDEEKDEEVEEQEQQQEEEEEVEQQQQEEEEEEVEQEQQQEEEEEVEQQQQQQQEEEEEVEQEEQQQEEAPAPAQAPGPGPAPIPIFIFEKRLTSSDVERNHNRLLISGRVNYLMASLMEEERGRVESNGRRDFLRVVTMTRNKYGVEYILHLKRWSGSGALVLKHEWGKLVRANELRIGDSVVGWVYRVDDELRLLLDIIRNHQVH